MAKDKKLYPSYQRQKDARKAKRAKGLCWFCSEPAATGKTRCEKHLKSSTVATGKYRTSEEGKAIHKRIRAAHRKTNPDWYRFGKIKFNASKRGIEFTITRKEFMALVKLPCHYCGLRAIGMDRKDNAMGYHIGNVLPCCRECNVARNEFFTVDEMLLIGQAIRNVKLARQVLA